MAGILSKRPERAYRQVIDPANVRCFDEPRVMCQDCRGIRGVYQTCGAPAGISGTRRLFRNGSVSSQIALSHARFAKYARQIESDALGTRKNPRKQLANMVRIRA